MYSLRLFIGSSDYEFICVCFDWPGLFSDLVLQHSVDNGSEAFRYPKLIA